MKSYPDGTFKPRDFITREEVVVCICNLINRDPKTHKNNIEFSDMESIFTWSFGYVNALVYRAMVKGYPDNTFRPENPITRAEVVVLLSFSANVL